MRILIADDEPPIRKGLAKMIGSYPADFEIIEADSGKSAMEVILTVQPEIAFLDIIMPFFDGLYILKKVAEQKLRTKIIIISGYSHFEYAQEALNRGAKGFLLKPLNEGRVHEMLKSALTAIVADESHETAVLQKAALEMQYRRVQREKCCNDLLYLPHSSDAKAGTEGFYTAVILFRLIRGTIPLDDDAAVRERTLWSAREFFLSEYGPETFLSDCPLSEHEFYLVINQSEPFDQQKSRMLAQTRLVEYTRKSGVGVIAALCGTDVPFSGSIHSYLHQLLDLRFYKTEEIVFTERDFGLQANTAAPENLVNTIQLYMETHAFARLKTLLLHLFTKRDPSGKFPGIRILYQQMIDLIRGFTGSPDQNISVSAGYPSIEPMDVFDTPEEVVEYLYNLFCGIIGGTDQGTDCRNIVELAKNYVEKNIQSAITVKDISSFYSINPNYFSTLFKKTTGINFIEYVNRTKTDRCCSLLAKTDLSVNEIAESSGYTDIQYFYRLFKKTEGCTPMEYRQIHRKNLR